MATLKTRSNKKKKERGFNKRATFGLYSELGKVFLAQTSGRVPPTSAICGLVCYESEN